MNLPLRLRPAALLAVVALAALLGGCTMKLHHLQDPPRALAVTSPDATRSMIYLARTDSGVVVIDLGWVGANRAIRRGLARMGASPEEVTAVLITHSHRDHIFGWGAVRSAPFFLGAEEVPLFLGQRQHPDLPSRAAAAVFPDPYPEPGEVQVRGLSRDTLLTFGRDTVWAFRVPGHTAGSTAYLLRGVLFIGDSLHRSYLRGLRHAAPMVTADAAENRASIAELWTRLEPHHVRWVCTAHAKCVSYADALQRLRR